MTDPRDNMKVELTPAEVNALAHCLGFELESAHDSGDYDRSYVAALTSAKAKLDAAKETA